VEQKGVRFGRELEPGWNATADALQDLVLRQPEEWAGVFIANVLARESVVVIELLQVLKRVVPPEG